MSPKSRLDAPDPRLVRALWQLLIVGGITAALAISAGLPRLGFGPVGWLVLLPSLALATALRAPLLAVARRRGRATGSAPVPVTRVSLRLPSRGAREACDCLPVPGRRVVRQPRRSQRNEHRSQPVAGRG